MEKLRSKFGFFFLLLEEGRGRNIESSSLEKSRSKTSDLLCAFLTQAVLQHPQLPQVCLAAAQQPSRCQPCTSHSFPSLTRISSEALSSAEIVDKRLSEFLEYLMHSLISFQDNKLKEPCPTRPPHNCTALNAVV